MNVLLNSRNLRWDGSNYIEVAENEEEDTNQAVNDEDDEDESDADEESAVADNE